MRSTEPGAVEALRRAHVALLDDLRKLEEASVSSSPEGLAGFRARLGAAHAHIADHFRFEEQNGYMEAVRRREPRLERTIQELAEEHRELSLMLEGLIARAESATVLDEELAEGIRAWVGRVRRHEARENDLVQDAFNLDVSAED